MFTEGGHYHPHLGLPHGEGGANKTAPVALNLFPHPSYKLGSLNFLFNTKLWFSFNIYSDGFQYCNIRNFQVKSQLGLGPPLCESSRLAGFSYWPTSGLPSHSLPERETVSKT